VEEINQMEEERNQVEEERNHIKIILIVYKWKLQCKLKKYLCEILIIYLI
jgi:hypothetical protein